MNLFTRTAAIAGVALSSLCPAEAAVWLVEKGDNKIYVGGTIHVLGTEDYPLPDSYQQAYADSAELVFETDIASLASPAFQAKVMSKYVYTGGETLADHIAPATVAALTTHLSARGLPFERMQMLSPGLMAITLALLELQLNGVEQAGIDAHFAGRAITDNKPVSWLESVDQQIDMIGTVADGHEDEYLMYSIENAAETMAVWETIRRAWRAADLDRMDAELSAPLRDEAPYAYNIMIRDRNNNWIEPIEALFDDSDTELVLVGMLHLAGPDGVLNQLESLGYRVTPLPAPGSAVSLTE